MKRKHKTKDRVDKFPRAKLLRFIKLAKKYNDFDWLNHWVTKRWMKYYKIRSGR